MRKNYVQGIILHTCERTGAPSLADRVSEFHTEIIERRLSASGLSPEQKSAVIDQIIENLKSQLQDSIK